MLRLLFAAIGAATLFLGHQSVAAAQGTELERLKKEIDLLKREIDLLKRENELLKAENAALKKGAGAKSGQGEAEAAFKVSVDNVEYVYQGMTRSGANVFITIMATSQRGDRLGPNGQITLIDDEGEKYTGIPTGGFGAQPKLREGVPVKLTWRLPAGKSATPSAKITRFPLLTIDPNVGGGSDVIEFRNVPTTIAKSKAK